MPKSDFITLQDYSKEGLLNLLKITQDLKSGICVSRDRLKGRTIALVFQKPSNRTRVSFEVGIHQLGGNCLYLGPNEISLGVRESVEDVAKTLTRYLDGIVARTHNQEDLEELAKHTTIPIINGLSDLYHPCQALADIYTIQEKLEETKGVTLAYVGDGNNVCHSLLLGCSKIGINIHIATPKGYEPNKMIVKKASIFAKESGSTVQITNNPKDAAKGAHVLYSDVWISMGQEKESSQRLKDFEGFQINKDLAKTADKDYLYMHCLPAHRGQEVTAEIIDGKHSIVFDQAENRLHTQKAILIHLFAD